MGILFGLIVAVIWWLVDLGWSAKQDGHPRYSPQELDNLYATAALWRRDLTPAQRKRWMARGDPAAQREIRVFIDRFGPPPISVPKRDSSKVERSA